MKSDFLATEIQEDSSSRRRPGYSPARQAPKELFVWRFAPLGSGLRRDDEEKEVA